MATISASVSSRPRGFAGAWNWLTEPSTLISASDRSTARLLSSLTFSLLILSIPLGLGTPIANLLRGLPISTVSPTTLTSIAILLVAYVLSRTRYFSISAWVLSVVTSAAVVASQLTTATPPALTVGTSLMYMSVGIILASFLLGGRSILVMALLNLVGIGIIKLRHPELDLLANLTAIGFNVLIPILVLIAVRHRNQLETDRQLELKHLNHELSESLKFAQVATAQAEEANLRLRESEHTLERRVEERTAELRIAKEQADEARHRAEQADRIKSQFLASMSHELRTPLNAILNFVDMTLMGVFGSINEEQADAMQKSLDSGKHLLSLINDVLDITKIHSGMMKLFYEDNVDLGAEVQAAASGAEPLVKNKPIQLVMEVEPNLPIIRADRRRIRQVLLNLLSNAAKFTEQGTITLRAKQHNGQVLFEVVDTGPGIAEDDQEVIFQPFQQTETGVRHAGGTGLGLPISRYLMEAHGGRLWVESTPGRGAAFFAALPITQTEG